MKIEKTKKSIPPRLLIHGTHGVGKSSLAAAAPNPLFINIEDGLSEIDTSALSKPTSFDDVMAQLKWVHDEKHDFKTLVIDSLDWMEALINDKAAQSFNAATVNDVDFGKGFAAAAKECERVIKALTAIHAKGMAIIMLAHNAVKEYQDPAGMNYDTWKLKMRDKNAELFQEFATLIGYLHLPAIVKTEKSGFSDSHKAVTGQHVVLSCAPSAAYASKNRYGIKTDIEIPNPKEGWNNLMKAIKGENNG